jgi:hypothetical protein
MYLSTAQVEVCGIEERQDLHAGDRDEALVGDADFETMPESLTATGSGVTFPS